MGRKSIFINVAIGEVRVAVKEDNKLAEFFTEDFENEKIVGNVYLGKVNKVLQGINAAFVNIGFRNDAFLHFSDVDESMEKTFILEDDDADEADQQTTIPQSTKSDVLLRKSSQKVKEAPTFQTKKSGEVQINIAEGQNLLVQVTREAYANKGVKISTKIAIPGRYMVLLPFDNLLGVSKKIPSFQERKRLRMCIKDTVRKSGYGCIIRTAAKGKSEEDFRADWDQLYKTWKSIESRIELASPPSIIYKDMNLAKSIIRDYLSSSTEQIIIDSPNFYREVKSYVDFYSPQYSDKIIFHKSKLPIFEHYEINKEISKLADRKVYLPSGGSIVIEATEAMVVIDVNSGRSVESEQEKTSYMTNQEAAKEIARQLRLRDIGGMIVIDFIDMMNESNKKKLYFELKNELMKDKAKSIVYPLTQLGLMQVTRQRINQNLFERFYDTCKKCSGTGKVASKTSVISEMEEWLKKFRSQSREFRLVLVVSPDMAKELTFGKFSKLQQLMVKYFVKINLQSNPLIEFDEFKFYSVKSQKEITRDYN